MSTKKIFDNILNKNNIRTKSTTVIIKRIALLTTISSMLITADVRAEVITKNCWATAYCITGTTASGSQTTEHRTVASKTEWFGMRMLIWEDDGDGIIKPENFIGDYVVEDTGGQPIRNGNVVDIYMPDYIDCKQFGGKKVIIQVLSQENEKMIYNSEITSHLNETNAE